MKPYLLRLDPDLAAALAAFTAGGPPASEVIRLALAEYLSRHGVPAAPAPTSKGGRPRGSAQAGIYHRHPESGAVTCHAVRARTRPQARLLQRAGYTLLPEDEAQAHLGRDLASIPSYTAWLRG